VPVDKNLPYSIPIPEPHELEEITLKRTQNLLDNVLDFEGWDASTIGADKGIQTYFKYMNDSPIVYMKAVAPEIPCSANTLLNWMYSPASTKEMDQMFLGEKLVHKYDDDNIINYVKYSTPWPLWPRDFVYLWTKRWTKEGYGIACALSVIHPEFQEGVGECQGFVRGELVETGMVVKDLGDPSDKKSSLTYVVCCNPRGWIPSMVVNSVAGNQAMNCIRIKERFEKVGDTDPRPPPLPKN